LRDSISAQKMSFEIELFRHDRERHCSAIDNGSACD
jgi:hypothetical protein